jgi:pimeloyl-ACP methyl ester carboxylesterase
MHKHEIAHPAHWVLLRGLVREAAHWGDFIALLQAHFPGSKITVVDLPGAGQYYRERSPASIQGIMEVARRQALADGLTLNPPVTFLAVSLGAMVAWEWLKQYPQDSAGALLINTSFASLSPFYHRMRWQAYPHIVRVLAAQNCYQRELAIVKLVANEVTKHHEVAKAWQTIQQARPMRLATAWQQLLAAARYVPKEDKPAVPVLLLASTQDRLVSAACTQAISQKWSLPLTEHSWAGHDLTLDDAPWVLAQAQQWLATLNN